MAAIHRDPFPFGTNEVGKASRGKILADSPCLGGVITFGPTELHKMHSQHQNARSSYNLLDSILFQWFSEDNIGVYSPSLGSANTQAELFAFGAECIFYGIYLISVWVCMSVLLTFAGGITVRRWPFFLVALLLFALSTLDVALGLRHLLDAFVYHHGPGGATAELLDISHWVSVMKVAAFLAQTCVADGMLVYRSYVIYARNWKIAAGLSVLWSAGVASSIYTVVMEATLHQSSTLSAGRFTRLALANASVTLVLNIAATSLIVYRIWSFDRFNKDKNEGDLRSNSTLRRAMRIIIESGAVYTVSVIVLFISNLAKSNSLYLISDCIMQIIGIVFNLIIIRVEQGSAKDTAYGDSKDLVSLQFQQRSALGETTHMSDLEEGKQDIHELR